MAVQKTHPGSPAWGPTLHKHSHFMERPDIRDLYHTHCRFRLRSGKEVYGVVWEVESGGTRRIFFASVHDYERFQRDPGQPISVIPMVPEEIVHAERVAV